MAADITTSQTSVMPAFVQYFKTVQGWLSVVPTVAAIVDAGKGWLPIATVIKPWVYIFIALMTLFSVWFEISRFVEAREDKGQKASMRKAAAVHICFAFCLMGIYWIFGELISAFTPAGIVTRTSALFALALLVGLIFAEVSRAFALLALTMETGLAG